MNHPSKLLRLPLIGVAALFAVGGSVIATSGVASASPSNQIRAEFLFTTGGNKGAAVCGMTPLVATPVTTATYQTATPYGINFTSGSSTATTVPCATGGASIGGISGGSSDAMNVAAGGITTGSTLSLVGSKVAFHIGFCTIKLTATITLASLHGTNLYRVSTYSTANHVSATTTPGHSGACGSIGTVLQTSTSKMTATVQLT